MLRSRLAHHQNGKYTKKKNWTNLSNVLSPSTTSTTSTSEKFSRNSVIFVCTLLKKERPHFYARFMFLSAEECHVTVFFFFFSSPFFIRQTKTNITMQKLWKSYRQSIQIYNMHETYSNLIKNFGISAHSTDEQP